MIKTLIASVFLGSLVALPFSQAVHASSEATTSKIPNASFENWGQTADGFLPNKWVLERNTAAEVSQVGKTSFGDYALAMTGYASSPTRLSTQHFYLDFSKNKTIFNLSVYAKGKLGAVGAVLLFKNADPLTPICTLNLTQVETGWKQYTQSCPLNETRDGSIYYVSASSSAQVALVLDKVSLAQQGK